MKKKIKAKKNGRGADVREEGGGERERERER
jgi:hypothetical protein